MEKPGRQPPVGRRWPTGSPGPFRGAPLLCEGPSCCSCGHFRSSLPACKEGTGVKGRWRAAACSAAQPVKRFLHASSRGLRRHTRALRAHPPNKHEDWQTKTEALTAANRAATQVARRALPSSPTPDLLVALHTAHAACDPAAPSPARAGRPATAPCGEQASLVHRGPPPPCRERVRVRSVERHLTRWMP